MRHDNSLRRGRLVASSHAASVALAVTLSVACVTKKDDIPPPAATLGLTQAAERDIRPLVRRWMLSPRDARLALEPRLAELAKLHRDDPLSGMVTSLMAWNAVERGEFARALELAAQPLEGPSGPVKDLATLVVGAAERRTGHPKEALARLLPLLHKMLDPAATSFLNEELLRAAVAASDWPAAIHLMNVWVVESAPADRQQVLAAIGALFERVPPARLLSELRSRVEGGGDQSPDERRIAESIAQHLARAAVARRDTSLARFLLRRAGHLLGVAGEDVARLAGDRTRAQVLPRTVGVLLALGSPALERRSADVLTGMAFAIGRGDLDARVVSRDDGGDPELVPRALAELAAEGAAVIVAGLDARHGPGASAFAREHGLPVLMLSDVPEASTSPHVFVLAEPRSGAIEKLAEVLHADDAKVVASIGQPVAQSTNGDEAGAGVGVELPCNPLPSADELKAERVDAFVALDGAYCSLDDISNIRGLRAPLGVGLGALVGMRLPDGAYVASSGIFPIPLDRESAPPSLLGWFESGRPAPNWWAALGRDAAVLAAKAVSSLTDASTNSEVRARREDARVSLLGAEETLWTSDSKRFDADRRLRRTVRIVRWRGGGPER